MLAKVCRNCAKISTKIGLGSDNAETFDILENYRSRNRTVRPPDPQQLAVAAANQGNLDGEDNNCTDESDTEEGHKRAARNSKNPGALPKPTDLGYYPPGWKSLLVKAKERWRRYVVTENPFPNRSVANDWGRANHILAVLKARLEHEGLILEPGLLLIPSFATF